MNGYMVKVTISVVKYLDLKIDFSEGKKDFFTKIVKKITVT